ncbi:hypothetical protein EJP67_10750 [Variovorax guangxiensis]|uniref:DEAD/DEAH box helicase n=1 Tax=Variovorax guangxiensis TaxID=1775474 RepID=A0A433MI93_9BURK|nr:protein DpdE [Variovorax guangxiensis]RUR67533.1 hypothetical protein EJP67_10750 [Variovorax guangxiensis]
MTFVVSSHAADLGVGKLLERRAHLSTVEYFDHPGARGRHLRQLPTGGLQPRRLEPQTRVFFCTDDGRWSAGRVVEAKGEGVEVQIGGQSILVAAADLHVRWAQPISDPSPFLCVFLSEAHLAANSRRKFLLETVRQRAEGAGLDGLLSSGVELYPHQMNVVRRVLTDPIQRYLLADEVGLGKTIEAAAIIRQQVIDDPKGHRVAVVVPEALVAQWRDELSRRFHLGPPFLDESVLVVHAGADELESALTGAHLVVVDEAHHIVGRQNGDAQHMAQLELIRNACHDAPSLLLLSATPAIADEDSFFALMQLIDPEVYPQEEREAFHQRIIHRHELAQIIAGFEPGAMQLLLDDGQRLCELFPDDARLLGLVESLVPIAREARDPTDSGLVEAVNTIRQHLSETYRLHRRILRNRRKNAAGLTPWRDGASSFAYSDNTAGVVARLIENWRIEAAVQPAAHAAFTQVYRSWLNALLEAPHTLRTLVDERFEQVHTNGLEAIEAEQLTLLQQHLTHWDPLAARLNALCELVDQQRLSRSKLVIFATARDVANRVFERLQAHLHGQAVARHSLTLQEDEDPEEPPEWTRFLRDQQCWVLVCDARAEEGLNLQGGRKAVLHFDLPLSPNRIEQRLGRVDRFGAGDPIKTLVLSCNDNEVEQAWVDCVIDGFGVGDRSIASLQYLVDAQMDQLQKDLFEQGAGAITALKACLGGEQGAIRKELRRIDQQDELEALQSEESTSFESLIDLDDDWRRVRESVEPWLQRGLQFVRHVQNDGQPGVEEIVRYWHAAGERATLVTAGTFRADFLGALDTEMRRRHQNRPTTQRYGYRRQTSVMRGTHLMRLGDPLFEGLRHAALMEDRGRVCATWHWHPDYKPQTDAPDLFFRFDFLLQADLKPALELFADNASAASRDRALQRRMDLALAPEYLCVWLDHGLQSVASSIVDTWLRTDDGDDAVDRLHRTDLTPAGWRRLRNGVASDLLRDWPDLIERAYIAARRHIVDGKTLQERTGAAVQTLKLHDASQIARLESRLATLKGREQALEMGRLAFEKLLSESLQQGVHKPNLTLDAIGAVFLSNQPLFDA